MFGSRIEAAERRLERSRRTLRTSAAATGHAVHERLCSPQAHLVALAAGFAWGLRPECRDVDRRGSLRVRKAVNIALRTVLSRFVAGLVA